MPRAPQKRNVSVSHTREVGCLGLRARPAAATLGRQYERVGACTCEIPASPARTTHAGTPDFVRTPPFSVSHCKRSDIPPPGVEAHFETRSAPQCQGAVRSSGRTCPQASTSFFCSFGLGKECDGRRLKIASNRRNDDNPLSRRKSSGSGSG